MLSTLQGKSEILICLSGGKVERESVGNHRVESSSDLYKVGRKGLSPPSFNPRLSPFLSDMGITPAICPPLFLSLMFAPLRPSASVVVSIHLLGRSLTVFAEHEIEGKAVGKTIEAELLQTSVFHFSPPSLPSRYRIKRESKWKWRLEQACTPALADCISSMRRRGMLSRPQ